MLSAPDHQVAGHSAVGGKLGPLIDESGLYYKPLQSGERGDKEVAFYESFYSDPKVPRPMLKFFPKFHGKRDIEASNGAGLRPHLVLGDIVSGYTNPSIIDLKIGSRTWYPESPDEYITKCLKRDKETTGLCLGFRISGLQVYNGDESGYYKPDRKVVKRYSVEDVRMALRKFVSTNTEREADCALAKSVYGPVLDQLGELKLWFEEQTIYQFNSCSVLLVYDKESGLKDGNARAMVKLVDFAHVCEGNGVIDHNFLGGLCSLIKVVSETLAEASIH